MKKVNGVWGYYVNGTLNTGYTGLAENSAGKWYVQSGIVSLSYNGNVTINGPKIPATSIPISARWNSTPRAKPDGWIQAI